MKNLNPVFVTAKDSKEYYEKSQEKRKQKIKQQEELKEKSSLQFRDGGSVRLEKQPCSCMANKIKQNPSS